MQLLLRGLGLRKDPFPLFLEMETEFWPSQNEMLFAGEGSPVPTSRAVRASGRRSDTQTDTSPSPRTSLEDEPKAAKPRVGLEQQCQTVDLSRVGCFDGLKKALRSRFEEIAERRKGKVVVLVPAKFVRDLGLWLEKEHPKTGCKELVLRNVGVGELIWQSFESGMKARVRKNLVRNLDDILDPLGGESLSENDTPRPDGGFYRPDVSGFVKRMSEDQSCRPMAEAAPWPQVFIEIAYTDSGSDYKDAKSRLENCVDFDHACVDILIGIMRQRSGPLKQRMNRDAMNITDPSQPATVLDQEPSDAPKMAVWSPGATPEAPSWYALRMNEHIDVVIPETAPPLTWRLEFNVICQCNDATAGAG